MTAAVHQSLFKEWISKLLICIYLLLDQIPQPIGHPSRPLGSLPVLGLSNFRQFNNRAEGARNCLHICFDFYLVFPWIYDKWRRRRMVYWNAPVDKFAARILKSQIRRERKSCFFMDYFSVSGYGSDWDLRQRDNRRCTLALRRHCWVLSWQFIISIVSDHSEADNRK